MELKISGFGQIDNDEVIIKSFSKSSIINFNNYRLFARDNLYYGHEGIIIRIFKYNGTVYFSSSKNINGKNSIWLKTLGIPTISAKMAWDNCTNNIDYEKFFGMGNTCIDILTFFICDKSFADICPDLEYGFVLFYGSYKMISKKNITFDSELLFNIESLAEEKTNNAPGIYMPRKITYEEMTQLMINRNDKFFSNGDKIPYCNFFWHWENFSDLNRYHIVSEDYMARKEQKYDIISSGKSEFNILRGYFKLRDYIKNHKVYNINIAVNDKTLIFEIMRSMFVCPNENYFLKLEFMYEKIKSKICKYTNYLLNCKNSDIEENINDFISIIIMTGKDVKNIDKILNMMNNISIYSLFSEMRKIYRYMRNKEIKLSDYIIES